MKRELKEVEVEEEEEEVGVVGAGEEGGQGQCIRKVTIKTHGLGWTHKSGAAYGCPPHCLI